MTGEPQWKPLRSRNAWKRWTAAWTDSGGIFDVEIKRNRIEELNQLMASPDFWNDQGGAQSTVRELKTARATVQEFDALAVAVTDAIALLELAEDEADVATLADVAETLETLATRVDALELKSLLSEEQDHLNAVVSIHPGAGGTESQDWAEMLLRMYLRWAERSGFQTTMLDYQVGDEAGLKDATFEVTGDFGFGYLKSESGVHRLVRISPFDSSGRRHTSFASVFVFPEVDETVEVEILDSEIRIDTFRASGAGGQHVNKTDSAIRLTHLPSGIVVSSQNERSQHRNRDNAFKILRARLYAAKLEEERKKLDTLYEQKMEIAWGSQIRSYVFQPYTLVKDHRTNHEVGDVQRVMDGDIDGFIDAWLRSDRSSARRRPGQ